MKTKTIQAQLNDLRKEVKRLRIEVEQLKNPTIKWAPIVSRKWLKDKGLA